MQQEQRRQPRNPPRTWNSRNKPLCSPDILMAADLFSVADRVALVTGASSGIGAYVAQGLARAGAARVYISGRRAAQLDKVAQAAPGVIIPLVGDVSTINGCKELANAFVAAETKANVQEVKLDLLMNNAGMGAQEGRWTHGASVEQIRDALLQTPDEDWAKVNAVNVGSLQVSRTPAEAGAHYFLDPLSWMRPQLEQGLLDGRLECPKCKTNVGKYAWQGMQCSCGDWVVPAISLAKGRIDEVKVQGTGGAAAARGRARGR